MQCMGWEIEKDKNRFTFYQYIKKQLFFFIELSHAEIGNFLYFLYSCYRNCTTLLCGGKIRLNL